MEDPPTRPELEEGLRRAADVELPLSIEVARIKLPLAELGRLRPGDILATSLSVGRCARLSAGGVDVAEGELVEVDGKLALLITAIPFKPDPKEAGPGPQ